MLLVTSDVSHVQPMKPVLLVLETELMPQHVLVQMVNGITTTYVKTVTINVEFVTPVPLIVPTKVNVLKTESIHQPVIVTLDTMMMDSMLYVMFVTANVTFVLKPDVILVQVSDQELQTVTVQVDIMKHIP